MKVGIYVGSFNPPHKGHKNIVNHLLNNYLNKIIIVPTGNYWDKNNLVDINHRINMLKTYKKENLLIDNKHNDIPYTYELLNILKKEYKNDELYLILGADNIVNFNKWKNFENLLNHNLLIINREDIDVNYYIKKYNINKYIIVNDFPLQNVSSTLIRNLLKNDKELKILNYIDKEIYNYIIENKLYKE